MTRELSPRPSLLRFVVDRNPFCLLSAVCMFAGCRAILAALDQGPGEAGKLIAVIGVLNLYEALLIGLALFLIRRRGLNRDGWILLGIEALFLVDLTHLNSEVYAASLWGGVAVNAACFVLALVKIAVVVRVLRLRVSRPQFAMIAVQLAVLFGMSGAFKGLSRDGSISAGTIYAAWWMVALLPALWAMVPRAAAAAGGAFGPLVGRLYVALPLVAILVHLCGANRVYNVHFEVANVAPLLLGLAVLAGRTTRWPGYVVANVQMGLAAVAVLMSLPGSEGLAVQGPWTPLRLVLLGAAATSAHALWLHRRWAFASMATACVATAALGRGVPEMRRNLADLGQGSVDFVVGLVPTTALQWGVIAVVASFVLLGVGAAVSLRKPMAAIVEEGEG